MTFFSTGRHYDTSVLNVSAYEIIGANFTINVGHLTGSKNITGKRPIISYTTLVLPNIDYALHRNNMTVCTNTFISSVKKGYPISIDE